MSKTLGSSGREIPASMNPKSKKVSSTRTWVLVSAGLIAVGGAAWALWSRSGKADESVPVPEAFAVDSIKQKMDDPEETKRLFASQQYDELADEQRRQVHQNKGEAFRQIWQDRVSEYFEAAEADREAILDRHLDALMAKMEQYDEGEEPKNESKKQQPSKSQKRPYSEWSRQERKAKSESGNPDQLARMMAYKTAIMKRAQARGIKMP